MIDTEFWRKLQIEVGEWSRRNFPNNKPYHPLLGIIEELGELSVVNDYEECCDAIGDTVIFMADFCARNDLDLVHVFEHDYESENNSTLIDIAGRLCHYYLKKDQGIRQNENSIDMIYAVLSIIITNLKYAATDSLQEIVEKVWDQVKQRDWIKFPNNGRTE